MPVGRLSTRKLREVLRPPIRAARTQLRGRGEHRSQIPETGRCGGTYMAAGVACTISGRLIISADGKVSFPDLRNESDTLQLFNDAVVHPECLLRDLRRVRAETRLIQFIAL
jgi:hypothetical protein